MTPTSTVVSIETKQAVAYLRVSSVGQIDGDGLPRQREAISRFAESQGYTLVGEYSDEGVSGKMELDNRPGLAACLERIENNGVRVVIVESADRLARDSMVSEVIVRQFQKVGGTILTSAGVNLTEGGDDSPTAALIRGILALIAEFDRRVTVLKLRAARQRKKARGEHGEGIRPFGSLPNEKPTITLIHVMKENGYTSEDIAWALNNLPEHPTRSGKKWRGSVIRKILARENAKHESTSESRVS